jgi:anti-sigma-K factor RskA
MKPDNPELRELLAAEYALGTLQGSARRRFERLLRDDPALRAMVLAWEEKLSPLGERVAPVTPPRDAWTSIRRQIGWRAAVKTRWWDSLSLWRGFAFAGSALALAMAIYLTALREPALEPGFIAVLTDEAASTAGLVIASANRESLRVEAVSARGPGPEQALELWLLPGQDRAPVSLGIVPAGRARTAILPPALREFWREGVSLAVSLEPAGGSPTGQPTGPVLYQGRLLLRG